MILVLTYHKVLRRPEDNTEFYSTTAEHLERHLGILAKSGLEPINPRKLAENEPGKPSSYLLSFDDGTRDHEELVLPLLTRFNQSAIFFVPTSKLNREGYLSEEGLRRLGVSGQSIGSHSHDHQRMDVLTEEDIRVQFQLSFNIIERITGTRPTMFAPPGGFMNSRVRRTALEAGVKLIRTMRWGYNKHPDLTGLCCVPVNRYMTEREFHHVLEFRSRAGTYLLKQAAKRLLPTNVYASLRDALIGWLRSK